MNFINRDFFAFESKAGNHPITNKKGIFLDIYPKGCPLSLSEVNFKKNKQLASLFIEGASDDDITDIAHFLQDGCVYAKKKDHPSGKSVWRINALPIGRLDRFPLLFAAIPIKGKVIDIVLSEFNAVLATIISDDRSRDMRGFEWLDPDHHSGNKGSSRYYHAVLYLILQPTFSQTHLALPEITIKTVTNAGTLTQVKSETAFYFRTDEIKFTTPEIWTFLSSALNKNYYPYYYSEPTKEMRYLSQAEKKEITKKASGKISDRIILKHNGQEISDDDERIIKV